MHYYFHKQIQQSLYLADKIMTFIEKRILLHHMSSSLFGTSLAEMSALNQYAHHNESLRSLKHSYSK